VGFGDPETVTVGADGSGEADADADESLDDDEERMENRSEVANTVPGVEFKNRIK